jgi:hypothetical protein
MASHKQWSRIWSTHPWAKNRDFTRNQKVACLWRFSSDHQSSQQRLGLYQKQHGHLLRWSTKTREKIPTTRNPTCSTRFKHRSRRPRKARIGQGEGPGRGVCRGTTISLHKITQRDNPWATSTNNLDHGLKISLTTSKKTKYQIIGKRQPE